MKMYGDHHILSHLWHDWLPKVYHCSNRWCPWHCHYCPFIILICPPALHPNSSDGQHIHTKLLYLWTQQKRTKWIPIPILCQFGMHELLFWLTYRLAILDWEFDQKSSSLNHHPLNWIPEVSLWTGNTSLEGKSVTPFYSWQEQTFQDAATLAFMRTWSVKSFEDSLSSTEQPLKD